MGIRVLRVLRVLMVLKVLRVLMVLRVLRVLRVLLLRRVVARCVCGRAMELAPTHTKRASALPEARHPPRLFSIKGIKFKLVGLFTLVRPCMR